MDWIYNIQIHTQAGMIFSHPQLLNIQQFILVFPPNQPHLIQPTSEPLSNQVSPECFLTNQSHFTNQSDGTQILPKNTHIDAPHCQKFVDIDKFTKLHFNAELSGWKGGRSLLLQFGCSFCPPSDHLVKIVRFGRNCEIWYFLKKIVEF